MFKDKRARKQEIFYTLYHLDPDTKATQELVNIIRPGDIHLAICVAICNEPYVSFLKTMACILANVAQLCRTFDSVWPLNIVIVLL